MSKRKRTNRTHLAAMQALRTRIVEGRQKPGSRLPTQRDLSRRFRVSLVTLQKAAGQLAREGFLQPMGRRGTFVADRPPHLCRYALVFPSRPDGVEHWTDFWTILRRAAAEVSRADERRQFVSFYGISGHSDVEDYQLLMADIRSRRLAGLILLAGPHIIWNTPLLDDCPVPRVYIGGDVWRFKIPNVSVDHNGFITRGLELAAKQGRRRPMVIGLQIDMDTFWPKWSKACERFGMEAHRWQALSVPPGSSEAARHLTQVLMRFPPEMRPDTLLVTDDHIVEEVTTGLLMSNLPEAQLPTVIAMTNFPKLPRSLVPVTFLGFDSVRMIRDCLDVLDVYQRGEAPPQNTFVPATFAFEQPESGLPDVGVSFSNQFTSGRGDAIEAVPTSPLASERRSR